MVRKHRTRNMYPDKEHVRDIYERHLEDLANDFVYLTSFLSANQNDEANVVDKNFITRMSNFRDKFKDSMAFICVYRDWLNYHDERDQLAVERAKLVEDLANSEVTVNKIKNIFATHDSNAIFNILAADYEKDTDSVFNNLCATRQEKTSTGK